MDNNARSRSVCNAFSINRKLIQFCCNIRISVTCILLDKTLYRTNIHFIIVFVNSQCYLTYETDQPCQYKIKIAENSDWCYINARARQRVS